CRALSAGMTSRSNKLAACMRRRSIVANSRSRLDPAGFRARVPGAVLCFTGTLVISQCRTRTDPAGRARRRQCRDPLYDRRAETIQPVAWRVLVRRRVAPILEKESPSTMASINNHGLTVTTNRPDDRASVIVSCDIEFTEVEVNAMNLLGLRHTLTC